MLTGHRGIFALSATQIAGWGSTYFLPAMLGTKMADDLGMTLSFAFAGVTLMLLAGAFVGPFCGRYADRNGPRALLVAGSLLLATGLLGLGLAQNAIGYAASWLVIGIATPMALTPIPFVASAWLLPQSARRSAGLLTLVGGGTTIVFLPLMAWLDPLVGWRNICFLFTALQIVVCVPLHAALLVHPPDREDASAAPASTGSGLKDPDARRLAFWAMAASFGCIGIVTWGLPLHLVGVASAYGLAPALAVSIGAIMGPAQMASRALEVAFGQRISIMHVGLASLALIGAACALPLLFGGGFGVLLACTIGFGFGMGANTVVRMIAPLAVFGRVGYASTMGRMARPLSLAFAMAPFALASVLEHGGPSAVLAVCAALSLAAFAGLVHVQRIVVRAGLQ